MIFRIVLLILAACHATASAQFGPDEQPGTVRLECGMLLPGLCSTATTVDPMLRNQKLEVRKIDQIFRQYLVSTRRSAKPVADGFAMPAVEFNIVQRRTSQIPLNLTVGLRTLEPFDTEGRSSVTLTLANSESLEIDVGITSLNSRHAMITGLNRQWQFGMSMDNFPDRLLYPGAPAPGLVSKIRNFDDPSTRLNVAQMLLEARKFNASRRLLVDIQNEFPDEAPRCERMIERWNDVVATHLLTELDRLRETGRHQLAKKYARNWPEEDLATLIRVKAKRFIDDQDEVDRRIEFIRQSIAAAVGDIQDAKIHQNAQRIWRAMKEELNADTLNRFATFELLGQDADSAPESRFALAATGWLLGADNATDRFEEAAGLFEIRFLAADYVDSADDEATFRDDCLKSIRETEGFSVERLAQVIALLPPSPGILNVPDFAEPGQNVMLDAEDTGSFRCLLRLPPEYRSTRRYPVLLAFPRGGMGLQATATFWQQQTDRHGYIVAVPEIYTADQRSYEASADQHAGLLQIIHKLKHGLSIDDDRIFLAGHGIGGEVAMDFGAAHPDLFAGLCSIGGLGRNHLKWTAHNGPDLPWYVVVGTRQPNYYRRMGPILRKLYQRVEMERRLVFCDVLFVRYMDRGFESYVEELPNLFKWMDIQRRKPLPDRIKAQLVRSTETNWFWLELDEVPERFVSLDAPNDSSASPPTSAPVSATLNRNYINIQQMPAGGAVRISPDLPNIDLTKPINIRSGSTRKIDFKASSRDLLEDFRQRYDRKRLCHMRVTLDK